MVQICNGKLHTLHCTKEGNKHTQWIQWLPTLQTGVENWKRIHLFTSPPLNDWQWATLIELPAPPTLVEGCCRCKWMERAKCISWKQIHYCSMARGKHNLVFQYFFSPFFPVSSRWRQNTLRINNGKNVINAPFSWKEESLTWWAGRGNCWLRTGCFIIEERLSGWDSQGN